MLKRIFLAIAIFATIFLLSSALVGTKVISANIGLVLWAIGAVAAVAAFITSKPKDNDK